MIGLCLRLLCDIRYGGGIVHGSARMQTAVADKFRNLSFLMNEKLKRRWAGCEAMALGRGGISAVAEATGLSRTTIRKGIQEIKEQYPELVQDIRGRIRAPGAGRPSVEHTDPTVTSDIEKLVDPATRGEPTSPLLWTSKSTRKLAEELQKKGHQVSPGLSLACCIRWASACKRTERLGKGSSTRTGTLNSNTSTRRYAVFESAANR